MSGVQSVSFTSNPRPHSSTERDKKKENAQNVATAVGGTGFAAKATRMASKRGLQQGESTLQSMMQATQDVMHGTSRTIKESKGLVASFKRHYKMFKGDAIKFVSKWKDSKILGPIIKSPVMKGIASGFGGILAVFVLISGVNRAIENGELAFSDLKNQYHKYSS